MSDQNYYEKLGVTEDATFDEIQDARTRLLQQYKGDRKVSETIEAAYDAILMQRLRMRQEGKIKVPEGIRFAEPRLSPTSPPETVVPPPQSRVWLQRLVDTPSKTEVLLSTAAFLSLSSISIFYPNGGAQILQMLLISGVGLSFYLLNRKEHKFGRAVLLTATGLVIGLVLGGLVGTLLETQISTINLTIEQFSTILTFILLWVISSFLR